MELDKCELWDFFQNVKKVIIFYEGYLKDNSIYQDLLYRQSKTCSQSNSIENAITEMVDLIFESWNGKNSWVETDCRSYVRRIKPTGHPQIRLTHKILYTRAKHIMKTSGECLSNNLFGSGMTYKSFCLFQFIWYSIDHKGRAQFCLKPTE